MSGDLSFAQNKSYGRALVDTLCSTTFNGRGYYQNGTNKAALYIHKEMEQLGLTTQLQPFAFPVNIMDGEIKVQLDKTKLIPGKDYLVHAGMPISSGKAKIHPTILYNVAQVRNLDKTKFDQQFMIIDPTIAPKEAQPLLKQLFENLLNNESIPNQGAILLTDKLTHRISNVQTKKPGFIIKKDAWNASIKKINWDVESNFENEYEANNVIGMLEGELPDSFIVVSAHLDHLGQMGHNTMFPGANDNASGIAMIMSLAKYFSEQSTKPKYSMVFIAFSGEEAGLRGSKYFAEHPTIELDRIKFLINLDILGTGDDGIQVVNGKIFKNQFDQLVRINEKDSLLKQVKIRGESCNSDHCPLYQKGVPSFFIYTLGGVSHYHDIYDKAETLPLTEFEDVQELLIRFIESQ